MNGEHKAEVDKRFPPLELETRAVVPTDCAAYHLNRQPQTLRVWACLENGALRPLRINGRLAWPVAELRRVLGVASQIALRAGRAESTAGCEAGACGDER